MTQFCVKVSPLPKTTAARVWRPDSYRRNVSRAAITRRGFLLCSIARSLWADDAGGVKPCRFL